MTPPSPPPLRGFSEHMDRNEVIAALYRDHHRDLLAYLSRRFGKSIPDPEDIVQGAFAQLAKHPDIGDIVDHRAYLFSLACNIAIDLYRKNFRRGAIQNEWKAANEALPAQPSAETILIDREKLAHVEAALMKMPKLRRRIFLMIRIENLSTREVAERFAMSEAAVYKHVARALHDCATALERADRKAGYQR